MPAACQNEAEVLDTEGYPEGKKTSFHQGSGRWSIPPKRLCKQRVTSAPRARDVEITRA